MNVDCGILRLSRQLAKTVSEIFQLHGRKVSLVAEYDKSTLGNFSQ